MSLRALYSIPVLAALTACDPDSDIEPVAVQWMDWPAEALVATPFQVHMVVIRPLCHPNVFRLRVDTDQSAVTFLPYFLVNHERAVCPIPVDAIAHPDIMVDVIAPDYALDTVITAPALDSTIARTFEMRAPRNGGASIPGVPFGERVQAFGDVTVRLSAPDTSRRNVAGWVFLTRDSLGCARVTPGTSSIEGFMLEDQADTLNLAAIFVRGYIHEATAPVCGQTRVFHLVSRN